MSNNSFKKWQEAEAEVARDLAIKNPGSLVSINFSRNDKTTKSDVTMENPLIEDKIGISVKLEGNGHIIDRAPKEVVDAKLAEFGGDWRLLVDYLLWEGNLTQSSYGLPQLLAIVSQDLERVHYFPDCDRPYLNYVIDIKNSFTRKKVEGKSVPGKPAYTVTLVQVFYDFQ